jgi:hypothetical protein
MKRQRLVAALAFAALACTAGAAVAGLKSTQPTTVVNEPSGAGHASGIISAARESDNDVEFLRCTIATDKTSQQAVCSARTAAGTIGQCWTQDARLLSAISNIRPDSFVTVTWAANGECTKIENDISSVWGPSAP